MLHSGHSLLAFVAFVAGLRVWGEFHPILDVEAGDLQEVVVVVPLQVVEEAHVPPDLGGLGRWKRRPCSANLNLRVSNNFTGNT